VPRTGLSRAAATSARPVRRRLLSNSACANDGLVTSISVPSSPSESVRYESISRNSASSLEFLALAIKLEHYGREGTRRVNVRVDSYPSVPIISDNVNFDTRGLAGALRPRLLFPLDMGPLLWAPAESLADGEYGRWRGQYFFPYSNKVGCIRRR
jgi:hypothetical protein